MKVKIHLRDGFSRIVDIKKEMFETINFTKPLYLKGADSSIPDLLLNGEHIILMEEIK